MLSLRTDEIETIRDGTARAMKRTWDGSSPALEENVETIKQWEQAALHARSNAERLSDWITSIAASGPVQVGHAVWFACWVVANVGMIPGITPFDPFPFPLLTTFVSLEAIFLALFVLASQKRLAQQSDKRAHLDLQIDLLAEREMTAVLQLLRDIAKALNVKVKITPEQMRDLAKETDIHKLTDKLDDVPQTAGRGSRGGERGATRPKAG
jgi:uncharacterized membrane protein